MLRSALPPLPTAHFTANDLLFLLIWLVTLLASLCVETTSLALARHPLEAQPCRTFAVHLDRCVFVMCCLPHCGQKCLLHEVNANVMVPSHPHYDVSAYTPPAPDVISFEKWFCLHLEAACLSLVGTLCPYSEGHRFKSQDRQNDVILGPLSEAFKPPIAPGTGGPYFPLWGEKKCLLNKQTGNEDVSIS